jgi:DNA-binding NarL/FixJ family response regulator
MADDHPIVRQGLRQMIEADPSLIIVAEAGDGQKALEMINIYWPDIVILDIDMPRMDGFDVVRELRQKDLPAKVIFLTMHSEEAVFQEAMSLGAKGYVLKDSAITDIVNSIKTVMDGKHFISPILSGYLLSYRERAEALAKEQPGLASLSNAERRVLKLIAEDKTSREIGVLLFVSHRTVETHRTNICRKLGLHGSLALVKFAAANKAHL